MRKLAMLTTALFGLAFVVPAMAQPNQAGPQPGLPPGAGIGAQNVVPPPMTGQVTTTSTGPAYSAPMASPAPMMSRRRRVRRARVVHHRVHHARMAPAAAAPAAPAQ